MDSPLVRLKENGIVRDEIAAHRGFAVNDQAEEAVRGSDSFLRAQLGIAFPVVGALHGEQGQQEDDLKRGRGGNDEKPFLRERESLSSAA